MQKDQCAVTDWMLHCRLLIKLFDVTLILPWCPSPTVGLPTVGQFDKICTGNLPSRPRCAYGTAKCWRMSTCVSVCSMCNIQKIEPNKIKKRNIFLNAFYHPRRRIMVLRSQDCVRSLRSGCARGSVIHALIDTLAHRDTPGTQTVDTHADRRQRNQYTTMHRFVCRRGFGSFFSCSLSACRRILVVVVRAQLHIPNLAQTRTRTLPHTI